MRTRSQQASPGGFLSLDDSAPRRTRSTRNTSQPNAQSSSSTQTTTRPKSQGTTKKTTTSRVAKAQTRKAPQRATRKSTRKTENQTTDGGQHESRNNEERAQTAPLDDKENLTNESQDPGSVTLVDSTALSELKSSSLSRKYLTDPEYPRDPYTPKHTPLGQRFLQCTAKHCRSQVVSISNRQYQRL